MRRRESGARDGRWPALDGRYPSLLGDLPATVQEVLCDLLDRSEDPSAAADPLLDRSEGPPAAAAGPPRGARPRSDHPVYALADRQTWAVVRDRRRRLVRGLRLDHDPRVAARQLEAFPGVQRLQWRYERGSRARLTRTPGRIFGMVGSLTLTATGDLDDLLLLDQLETDRDRDDQHMHNVLMAKDLRRLAATFPALTDLTIDTWFEVDRIHLLRLGSCAALRKLDVRCASVQSTKPPSVLPQTLTHLRVLNPHWDEPSPDRFAGGDLLQELDMPTHALRVRRVLDLVRLARLRKVRVASFELAQHIITPDLPRLAWTHVETVTPVDSVDSLTFLALLLPSLPDLQHVHFDGWWSMDVPGEDVAPFVHLLSALAGKYETPRRIQWGDLPDGDLPRMLAATLSNAADRPAALELSHMTLGDAVLRSLQEHAPQVRHLTLHCCKFDLFALARACAFETLTVTDHLGFKARRLVGPGEPQLVLDYGNATGGLTWRTPADDP